MHGSKFTWYGSRYLHRTKKRLCWIKEDTMSLMTASIRKPTLCRLSWLVGLKAHLSWVILAWSVCLRVSLAPEIAISKTSYLQSRKTRNSAIKTSSHDNRFISTYGGSCWLVELCDSSIERPKLEHPCLYIIQELILILCITFTWGISLPACRILEIGHTCVCSRKISFSLSRVIIR